MFPVTSFQTILEQQEAIGFRIFSYLGVKTLALARGVNKVWMVFLDSHDTLLWDPLYRRHFVNQLLLQQRYSRGQFRHHYLKRRLDETRAKDFPDIYRSKNLCEWVIGAALLQKLSPYVDQDRFVPIERKPGGCAVGTIYSMQNTDERWLGKIGRSHNVMQESGLSTYSRSKAELNVDTVREEVAARFYRACSQGLFIVPQTCLSRQKVMDDFNTDKPGAWELVNQGIQDCLRIMARMVSGYRNFAEAKTNDAGGTRSFLEFLQEFRRPPQTILNEQGISVPLLGLMELLATARILADVDSLGGRLDNAGWIWERDGSGKIVAAIAVKIDLGEAFSFSYDENDVDINLVHWTVEQIGGPTRWLKDLKDIQVANRNWGLTIIWNQLLPSQQARFLDHAINLIDEFLAYDNERYREFFCSPLLNRDPLEHMPDPLAQKFMKEMKQWLLLQRTIYQEALQINHPFSTVRIFCQVLSVGKSFWQLSESDSFLKRIYVVRVARPLPCGESQE
jgi:hypothetical protein